MKSFDNLISVTAKAAMRDDLKIRRVISQIVPASTLTHIQFCRVEGGRVRITVSGSVWVSRLRFLERQIIDALRAQKYDCHTLSYHVAPAETPVIRRTLREANRSPASASALEQAANALVTDSAAQSAESDGNKEKLRQQLLRLAETLRSKR